MAWTKFHDMHSGGGLKEPPYHYLFIEAPKDEARVIFFNRFGHSPDRVSCTCCGEDYVVDESPTLEEATAYERGLRFVEDERGWGARGALDEKKGRYLEPSEPVPEGMAISGISRIGREDNGLTLAEYVAGQVSKNGLAAWRRGDVLFVHASDIKPEERIGGVPTQGYVWQE